MAMTRSKFVREDGKIYYKITDERGKVERVHFSKENYKKAKDDMTKYHPNVNLNWL